MERDETGKFKEGNPGKPKGAVNKITTKVKELTTQILECYTEQDIKDMANKIKQEKPEVLFKFLSTLMPKELIHNGTLIPSVVEAITVLKDNHTDISGGD